MHVTAGGQAAVFFVTPAGGTSACGYTYAGKPAGRSLTYPPCMETCAVPWPSPDGHYALTGFTVTDTASGRAAVQVSDDVADYLWASDSRHLCGVLSGPASPVVLVIAGLGGRPAQVTLAPVFTRVRYSGISLLACDPRHARAVLQTEIYIRTTPDDQAVTSRVDDLLGAQANPENPSQVNVSQPSDALTAQADAAPSTPSSSASARSRCWWVRSALPTS